jgi:Flp pilus assembly protein TadG
MFRRRTHDECGERGASMVEFAMLAPVFFLVIFGIVEMALMFQAWASVQHGSELGARYAVVGLSTCTSGGTDRVSCIISEARKGIGQVQNPASATITVDSWKFPSYSTKTANSAGGECDAVQVTVKYTRSTITPIISAIIPSVTVTGSQRFINEPFTTCA